MLKLTGSLILSALLFLPHQTTSLKDSIKPLSWTSPQIDMFGEEYGEPIVKNHCTAWAYHTPNNPNHTHWITAAHCIVDHETGAYENHDYQIDGHELYVEDWKWPEDIASLASAGSNEINAPGLLLAPEQPQVEGFVKGAGFPYGLPFMVTVRGSMAALDALFPGETTPYNIYELPVAPGNSGGPVMDDHDRVIGLTQIGFGGYSPISGGLALWQIRVFVAGLQ